MWSNRFMAWANSDSYASCTDSTGKDVTKSAEGK